MKAHILCIGGFDPCGGAGVLADTKAVGHMGGHALCVLTALTAQNTQGVRDITPIAGDTIAGKLDALLCDIEIHAVKIGMLGSADAALVVGECLRLLRSRALALPIILDPVLRATGGQALADDATQSALFQLLPYADMVTPNLPELAALGGAERLFAAGANHVLIKGGHGEGEWLTDKLLSKAGELVHWDDARIGSGAYRGTGCTLAAGIACGMGQGLGLIEAVTQARHLVRHGLENAHRLGQGAQVLGFAAFPQAGQGA
jgi:hydroxymethylpyrimidine/phosphomethylpyrimidine kinase